MTEPDEFRTTSRERWERQAAGWGAQRERMRRASRSVTEWMLDAVRLAPGQTVLELAAGPGDTGLEALERVQPGGRLIATDGSVAMVELVAERAGELGLEDAVEARPMEAEWIDLSAATVDAVLCRWGYMLLVDPAAALRETRRVLRPGGRVALAAWDGPQRNPWASTAPRLLVARGVLPAPDPSDPGQFAWADRSVIAEQLADAGFTDVEVATIEFTMDYPDLDAWWDFQIDLNSTFADALAAMTPAQRDELRDEAGAAVAEHVAPDGSVTLPAATHVAAAEA